MAQLLDGVTLRILGDQNAFQPIDGQRVCAGLVHV